MDYIFVDIKTTPKHLQPSHGRTKSARELLGIRLGESFDDAIERLINEKKQTPDSNV